MLKFLIVGIWGALVALGASYAASRILGQPAAPVSPPTHFEGLEYTRLEPITVPIAEKGQIAGYVLATLGFTAGKSSLSRLKVPATAVALSEALVAIHARQRFDVLSADKKALDAMLRDIAEGVNQRVGEPLVHEVLLESITWVSREQTLCAAKAGPGESADRQAPSAPSSKAKPLPHGSSH